jgi:hypothetical protein
MPEMPSAYNRLAVVAPPEPTNSTKSFRITSATVPEIETDILAMMTYEFISQEGIAP